MAAVTGFPTEAPPDRELLRLSAQNPSWKFECDDYGALIVSPTSTPSGRRGPAYKQLEAFAKQAGGQAFDSSMGFRSVRGALFCPEASWVAAERVPWVMAGTEFRRMMPDIVIEVAGYTDNWIKLKKKIDRYVEEGAAYAIAIEPRSRRTYECGQRPEALTIDLPAITDA